jgi:broad specificity phosphatase PhoE
LKEVAKIRSPQKKGAFFMAEIDNAKIYLIRHAETVFNTMPHLVGGRSNYTPLTEKGIEQSKRLGRILLEKGILPDVVHVSPAIRTLETARISLEEMGLDVEPIIHDEIQEMSQGIYEGVPREQVYTPEVKEIIKKRGKTFKLKGGESMRDTGRRFNSWLVNNFGHYHDDPKPHTHFVYTHGGTIKYTASYQGRWNHERTLNTPVGNTKLSLVVPENGKLVYKFINKDVAEL